MRHSSRQRFSPFQPVLPFLFSLPHPLRPHRRKHRMIHPPPPPATFSSTPEASVVRRDAKNGRARPGYFINISFRCLSLPRCSGGAARQRRRPASGHRYPLPPPPSTRSGHTRRAKRGGEGEKESLEKKGRQIYIYIYIERRGGGAASLERGRGALYYRKTERSRGDSFFTFLPPLPRKQGRSFREYNPCYRLLSGRNDDFLVHPSSLASLNRSSSLLKFGSVGCLSMDYGIYRCVYRWIREFVEFSFCKSFST